MLYIKLFVAHLKKFMEMEDRSLNWVKEAEFLLDQAGLPAVLFDAFQEHLSLYRPGGGEFLIDEDEMAAFLRDVVPEVEALI